jgi:hypothetical protein
MPDRRSTEDPNEIAARILAQATGGDEIEDERARRAAKILGRRGGLKGGPARAKKLSKKRRQQIAKKAANARWSVERDNESE